MKPMLPFLLLSLLASAPARATEWLALGARGVGMGGAGVALSRGPVSSYWNPGALGAPAPSGVEIPLSAHVALTGRVLEGANDLRNLGDNPAGKTAADVNAALSKFNEPGNGLRVDAGIGLLDAKIGRLAVFVNGFGSYGAVPQADLVNTVPATITTLNNSKVTLKGANIAEFGVGYGHELPFAPGLYAGGNLKLLRAQVGFADFFVLREELNSSAMAKKLKEGSAHSANFGMDAGLLWDLARSFDGAWLHPRVGLTGRNLNNPKFKQPEAAARAGLTGQYALNPQYRLGAAISPFTWWNVAADLDLSRNLTVVDNAASRQFALGTEFNIFNRPKLNVPVRLGLQKNIADRGGKTLLSFGSGLSFLHASLDASLMWSPKTVKTKTSGGDEKAPAELSVGMSLSVLFGGAKDDEAHAAQRRRREAREAPPAPSERVREASEKAHKDLDAGTKKAP